MADGSEDDAWLEAEEGARTPIGERLSIGRERGNDLVLASEKLSRRHALIQRQEGEFWIADLGSRNGTYLKGRLLLRPQRLQDGDRISLGGHVHVFRFTGGQEPGHVEITTTAGGTLPEMGQRACWFLVADIAGYTAMGHRMPADAVARVVGRWIDECWRIIERHDGVVNKFLGDGFFAYWEDAKPVRDGLRAAIEALCGLQQRNDPPFRFVVHRGQAVFSGRIGGEELIMSPDTTFVFRMEKLAKNFGVSRLLSAASHEALGEQLGSRPLANGRVPGFDGEFPFFTFGSAPVSPAAPG